jgi:hypothetical protein
VFNKYTCKDRELVMRSHLKTCLALCALCALCPASTSADFTFGIGGNLRYSARDWEQLIGTAIGPFMLALNDCGDEYDPSCGARFRGEFFAINYYITFSPISNHSKLDNVQQKRY